MMLDRADAAAEGDADDDRHLDLAGTAEMQPGDLADDLVERRVDESVELNLERGTIAADGQTARGAEKARAREGGIEDAGYTQGRREALG